MIYLYTQPTCLPCKRVASKLLDAGIDHQVIDVTKNLLAADYVKRVLQAKSTPIVETEDGEVIVGYQPDKLSDLIGRLTA